MRTTLPTAALVLLAALLVTSCGGGGNAEIANPNPPPPPPPPASLAVARVFPNLTFSQPVAMLQAPADASRWFVVEQNGTVRVFPNDATASAASTFVDVRALVAAPEDGRGGETGLLGMAFHPQFATNGRVFLGYTVPGSGAALAVRVAEFRSADGATLDPIPVRVLLTINKPIEDNHNGGGLAFGTDGFLYVGVGDGGGANDQHGTIGNGQSLTTLLGKMLRIDVDQGLPYGIPQTNPFIGNAFCGGGGAGTQPCPEIFAYGFRNPWRFSIDRANGELWVGDVGQGALEEVDRVNAGGNFGWRCREGTNEFSPNCGPAQNLVNPIAQYGRTAGRSITGGYVYRGTAIPTLQDRYVFGDFLTGNIWHIARNTTPTLDVTSATASAPVVDTSLSISSFAEGVDGELYVLDHGGSLHRLQASP